MVYRRGIQFFCLLAVIGSLFSQSVRAQSAVHTVARGDTLYSIARSYQVSQEDIMRVNGITNAARIQAGMRLIIPVPSAAASTNTRQAYSEYIVRQDDTLYSIARNRGVALQDLLNINGFSNNYVIRTGEKIKIPGRAAAGAPSASRQTASAGTRTASPSVGWPIRAKEVQYMTGKLSGGVLITGERSESIRSLTRGTVIAAGPYRGYGNIAVVEAEGGYLYLYGSCETLSVRQGDRIGPGTELGRLGIYPASGKPDLVFMVYRNDSPVDPAKAPRAL